MEKIFRFFGREYGNINQAAILLGSFALLSQILGLIRDRLLAHFIGPSSTLDIYYASFRVPDLIFISIASLASITVIIPFMVFKMKDGAVTPEARKFLNDIFTVFFFVIVIVSVFVFFLMPHVVYFIAPGFKALDQAKVVEISRIMLLSPILLGLSNLFGTITQLFRRFFLYALSPIFYNLGIITGILFFYPFWGIYGLAFGVTLGAFLHFMIQALSATQAGLTPKFSFSIDFGDIKKAVMTSFPRTLGLAMNNLALISIVALASFLKSGSISVFNFSLNIQSIPLNIIGVSYAVAAFPTLVKSFSSGKSQEFKDQLKKAGRAIVFWSVPLIFIFIVVRAQIVRVLLGSPSFSWENTRLVAAALAIFSVSMLAQSMIALMSRAYYAKGNTRRPLFVNSISAAVIIILSFVLLHLFNASTFFRYFIESLLKVTDIPGTEVLMLPLAYSIGTVLNFVIHLNLAKKEFMDGESFISKTFFQTLGASFFVGFVAYLSLNFFSSVFGTTTFWGVFFQGFLASILGLSAGILILSLLKNEELSDLIKTFKTKFWRVKVLPPSQEGL